MSAPESAVYYDPYDFEIDANPYPVWKRLRDEEPLYYNERYDFYALSRFEDVERGLIDWRSFISGRGTLLEIIKAGVKMPPGLVIFEDPPTHEIYRGLLSRVFTPRKMSALEPQVRRYCEQCLDPFVGAGRFDFIKDLGAQMPMRVIGMLLGIPEADQQGIRDQIDAGLRLASGEMPDAERFQAAMGESSLQDSFSEYIDWRAKHPSDDLMTELLHAEFEDQNGVTRRLTRDEVLSYVRLLASAGNETTTRLIGWTGKVLSDHPGELRKLTADRSLVPNAVEEVLRFEAPSPVQARHVAQDVELHGKVVREGNVMLLLNGSANRDERKFADADRFDVQRKIDHHLSFGYGIHFCLGASLARLEGRVALDEVLKRFPSWEVDREHAVQARTSTVRGWESLPVFTGS
jgi:cytochrome P450